MKRRAVMKQVAVGGLFTGTSGLVAAQDRSGQSVVESIDQLKNIDPSDDLYSVFCTGFSSFNDGGGGLFVYRKESSQSPVSEHNDRIVVVPKSGNGRWHRFWDGGPLNILWFGAKSGQSYDCAEAYNTALVYGSSGSDFGPSVGKTLYFPTGEYWFKKAPDVISTGMVLTGEGSFGSSRQFGTTLVVDYESGEDETGFIQFDESSGSNTGGGLSNLSVTVVNDGFDSNIIALIAKSDYVSYWTAQNLIIGGYGRARRALFARDFSEKGDYRIRDINLINCYFSGATRKHSTIVLSDVANVFVSGGFVYPAQAKVPAGIWLSGATTGCKNVHLTGGTYGTITKKKVSDLVLSGHN